MRARSLAMSVRLIVAVLLAAAAAPSLAAQDVNAKDAAELKAYTLTKAKFDVWIRTTLEISRATKDTASEAEVEADDESVDGVARRIEAIPAARNALRRSGISAREYTILSLVVAQAAMADRMMQQYPTMKAPDINRANLAFMREHRAYVREQMAKLEVAGHGTER